MDEYKIKSIEEGLKEANHNFRNFEIALRLACEIN